MENSMIMKRFEEPPRGYGIVPFYWWHGDRLDEERIQNQLIQLQNHSISGLQINYAHGYEGGQSFGLTYESEPALFSEEWWELFRYLVSRGRKEGFSVSLSDYTLGSPGQGWYTDEILKENPDMAGWKLREEHWQLRQGETVRKELSSDYLSVHFLTEGGLHSLAGFCREGRLEFSCGQDVMIVIIYKEQVPLSLNPMHPSAGKKVCEKFFQRFAERCPGEEGQGLNFFFSDELNFGISGRLWDRDFSGEFRKEKGYDILEELPLLFYDVTERFSKVRLDYFDMIVRLEEKNYFEPVFRWHEERNMIYGCDHGGRGYQVTEFGDYFRTQKYNQGPGCDQPRLHSDIIKNKVASSIAHLYNRPRVWLEGFYGSGWGTTSGQFMDAVVRNYVMGHNLLSVHGLYYSTHGGWWEWAPPCNGFHMPYWKDMGQAFKAIERVSYLFSQGVHVCDVAVIYPVADMEGSLMEEYSGTGKTRGVEIAFQVVRDIYSRGQDVDFIDFESILAGDIKEGRLLAAGEVYRVIILPGMKTVRYSMMEKLLAFKQNGGIVLCIGQQPEYSDAPDREMLGRICRALFENDEDVYPVNVDFANLIRKRIVPDILSDMGEKELYVNHRKIGDSDFYMLYGLQKRSKCRFRARGKAICWNPYDGKRYSLDYIYEHPYTEIHTPMEAWEFQIIELQKNGGEDLPPVPAYCPDLGVNEGSVTTVMLDDMWGFECIPTLNNQYGDFELPAENEKIGPQARRMHYRRGEDQKEELCYCGYGPYFLTAGPFETEEEYVHALEDAAANKTEHLQQYIFSMRYGLWGDPGIQGYHGLKGKISDACLVIGRPRETELGIEYDAYEKGRCRVFYTNIYSEEDMEAEILTGMIKPEHMIINGKVVGKEQRRVVLHKGFNPVAAGYRETGRTWLFFAKGSLKEQDYPLAMKWYRQRELLPLDCCGQVEDAEEYF